MGVIPGNYNEGTGFNRQSRAFPPLAGEMLEKPPLGAVFPTRGWFGPGTTWAATRSKKLVCPPPPAPAYYSFEYRKNVSWPGLPPPAGDRRPSGLIAVIPRNYSEGQGFNRHQRVFPPLAGEMLEKPPLGAVFPTRGWCGQELPGRLHAWRNPSRLHPLPRPFIVFEYRKNVSRPGLPPPAGDRPPSGLIGVIPGNYSEGKSSIVIAGFSTARGGNVGKTAFRRCFSNEGVVRPGTTWEATRLKKPVSPPPPAPAFYSVEY